MCGFIGSISKNPISYSDLNNANQYIVCRGPDKNIFYNNENKKFKYSLNKYFHFEFNRLSILDLSEQADQPMYSEISDNMLMFNGEIYNHDDLRKELESTGTVFNTDHSDTEVILQGITKHGLDFIEKLNGQFSIFFLNNKYKKAYLIRDRLGQKPLYFSLDNERFIFSSNFLSINKVLDNSSINEDAINNYLNVGIVPGKNTILNQVSEVLPAQIIEINIENLKITNTFNYWEIDRVTSEKAFDENEFLSLFQNSVKIRQIADVPIAYFLSGGVDSSSILQSAYETSNEKINSYSVTHQNKKYDESVWSNIVANKFETNHHTENMTKNIEIELINEALLSIDQPYFDPSVVPSFILSNMISKNYKVAISGDGGDELLCGYERVIKSHTINQRSNISKYLFKFYPAFLGTGNKILRYSKDISESYWSFHEDLKLMKLLKLKPNQSYKDKYSPHPVQSLKELMCIDYKFYLSEMMLFKVDRTSMANSLEVRSPYLDYRLIEYVFQSNLDYIDHSQPKKIMKNYLSSNFDAEFLNRPKQGFVFDVEKWVYKNISYIENELKGSIINEYNKKIINTLSINKSRINGIRIWKLFVLSDFMKRL